MRRIAMLPLLLGFTLRGELIDRVAVSIERQVITESELLRQIRVTAFFNGEKPDFSPESRRNSADRLVEQTLIRREISTARYMPPGSAESTAYNEFRKARYPDPSAYSKALAAAEITDADVRASLSWQLSLLEFVDMRFRPGIQITETEIREYYNDTFVPELKSKGKQPPSFADSRAAVEEILTSQRVDNALDRWLGQARTQTRIRFREPVFR